MSGTTISQEAFGKTAEGQDVVKFTLKNENGVAVQIINYGATITSIVVPDKNGKSEDVCLGYDNIEGYQRKGNPYFGAVVGRVANRIAKGKFTLDGKEYTLAKNNGENSLHGGIKGLDKVVWKSAVVDNRVCFSYLSHDGEEGYPGDVLLTVSYGLSSSNGLELRFTGTSTAATPVNLANHVYFNLAGHTSGEAGLNAHNMHMNADTYTPVSAALIPTGEEAPVGGTVFDLRTTTSLGEMLPKCPGGDKNGYDHNFCVSGEGMRFVCRVDHPESGRSLECFSNQPGVQFYTGNFIPADGSLKGKGGCTYSKHGGFCLETQVYPDAINQPSFPNCVLRPGEVYDHQVTYKFMVNK